MILPGTGRGTGVAGGGGVPRMLRPEVATARKMRRTMSLPEVILWERLRAGRVGFKVRRQHPIGPYVVDFFCRDALTVIEIDGEAHGRGDRPVRDAVRSTYLQDNGYGVIRFTASEVLKDIEAVVTAIVSRVARPLHHSPAASGPPSRSGEDFES